MNQEEREALEDRMRIIRERRRRNAELSERSATGRSGDDSRPRWSDFEKEIVRPLAELRATSAANIDKVIIADDRSKADKTPEQVMREGESIEDRWAREKEERMFENLIRYENGPGGKLINGQIDGTRWRQVKDGIEEATGKDALQADLYHRIVLRSDNKEDQLDVAWRRNPDKPRSLITKEFEKRFEKWREDNIKEGIRQGYLEIGEKGYPVPVHKDRERPGVKIITGCTRGMEGPDGPAD